MKLFKKFDEGIKLKTLFLYWFGYLFIGICLMLITTPLSPSFSETQDEISDNLCTPINFFFLSIAFLTETLLFFYLPWKFFKLKGLKWSISIWSILHLVGGTIPIFLYICVTGVFYYRLLEIKRVFSVFFFHFLINLPAILSCLL